MRARARDGRLAASPRMLDAYWLRRLCLDAGADDVGFVEIERAELAEERAELDKAFLGAWALISTECRMNREPARSPARSVANLAFHAANRRTDVAHRFPAKRTKPVGNGLRPRGVDAFAVGLPLTFQREASRGLAATYQFQFTGAGQRALTVEIRDRGLTVREGRHGSPDLQVRADTHSWFAVLAGERPLLAAVLLGRIRLRGSPRLPAAFGRCFLR